MLAILWSYIQRDSLGYLALPVMILIAVVCLYRSTRDEPRRPRPYDVDSTWHYEELE